MHTLARRPLKSARDGPKPFEVLCNSEKLANLAHAFTGSEGRARPIVVVAVATIIGALA